MIKRLLLAAGVVLLMSGCSSTGGTPFTLATNTNLKLGVALGAAAAIYLIYDPLAPNWELEEKKLSDDTYRLSMKMKRFHTGGSGEAMQILKRRASQLREEGGHVSYEILEYTEGIESRTLGAQRVAEGLIRIVRRESADSFRLSGNTY